MDGSSRWGVLHSARRAIDIHRSSEHHIHVYTFALGRALSHLLRVSKYDELIPLVTIIVV